MKKLLFILGLGMALTFGSCSKDESTGGTSGEKKLDKSNILSKEWESQDGSLKHQFRTDGSYRQPGFGTWEWLNNSDSMEITSTGKTLIWYFDYCEGDELQCRLGKSGNPVVMKDHDW